MDALIQFIGPEFISVHFAAFIIGAIRIGVFVSMVPFFGPQVSTAVKMPIVVALYIPLHPFMLTLVGPLSLESFSDFLSFSLIVFKEIFLGVLFAWLCSLVFYVALSAGTIIDNQRGASMAQGADLLSGAESSPLGSVLFLAMITLFFTSGAFVGFLNIFYATFIAWPPTAMIPAIFSSNVAIFSAQSLTWMMEQVVLVCAPFILVALMCDIALGLMNRFAPQLNVFILSMPIKSGVCAFLIIFYLNPFLNHSKDLFLRINENFNILNLMFGTS